MDEKVAAKPKQSKRGGKRAGSGRKPGIPNKISGMLKDAVIDAATEAGGDGGLRAYLKARATDANPAPFMSLLGKVLPTQVTGEDGGALQITVQRFTDA